MGIKTEHRQTVALKAAREEERTKNLTFVASRARCRPVRFRVGLSVRALCDARTESDLYAMYKVPLTEYTPVRRACCEPGR